ncbi:MAG: YihA family ribosome biogenesis GTP-binding protein [Bacteroidetes bacterium]|nr:YihA family ribosome biogenesis GTP-binding protein [Bacteroidota bacterium]
MKITNSEFLMSNKDIERCPKPNLPEYAFIGRSNVGKSSLINMLCNKKNLAKTSSTPGKTQLINHFIIDNIWYLVDLPGYGYARNSKSNIKNWETMIVSYLTDRENLLCTFVLIDSRIPPQLIDLEFMEWMAENELPFCIVFTKTDKLKATELKKNLDFYNRKLSENWDALPIMFISSATKSLGKTEILQFISDTNKLFTVETL